MLKIQELRRAAYDGWEMLCSMQDVRTGFPLSEEVSEAEALCLPYANPLFKNEVRDRFGDLRRRSTWEKAAIAYSAHAMVQSYLEPAAVVGYMATPDYLNCKIRQHYGDRVIDEMFQFPEILPIVKRGLEQLLWEPSSPEYEARDRETALQFLNRFRSKLPAVALPAIALPGIVAPASS